MREVENPMMISNDGADNVAGIYFSETHSRRHEHVPASDPSGKFKDQVEKSIMYEPQLMPWQPVHTGKAQPGMGYDNDMHHMMSAGYQQDFVDTIAAREAANKAREDNRKARLKQSIAQQHSKWMQTKRNKSLDPVPAKPLWKMSKFANIKSRTDTGAATGATYPRK